MIRKPRWLGVAAMLFAVLAVLIVLALAMHARTGLAAGGEDGFVAEDGVIVIPPSANQVVHSPEELAEILRQGGMDEASVQRILELERRIDEAHRQGVSVDEMRRLIDQWTQELFPGPEIPEAPAAPEDEKGSVPQPSAWFTDTVGIYASCRRGVRAAWGMPGYRSFYSWFRAHSGNLYIASGYCPYAACTIVHRATGDTAWDTHSVSLWDAWPYWHTAGCQ